ncbi:MAG TPA: serine/threonine-protein kinase [Kofleriaceae bacterium]
MTEVAAEVGSTANNYQILARLALGGMAEIFLARGISTTGVERYCVLKRILRDRASDVHFVRMFLDEARLAAQLQHPNVAQVYDIGKLGDSYFFTMEYVHGETIRAILQRARSLRREIPLSCVMTIAAGAAAGLHHAHDRIGVDGRPLGIVHRDVSPSNLMASYEGGVKVVDFGVAKAADRMQETRSGTVKGKISYLSPEQCRGQPIDRRSDLFSLGIVFWETLVTERLFKRNSDFENMTAIVTETPPLPSSRRRDIPPELDAISMRLLAKDPAARFQSGDELVEALEETAARTGNMISSSALGRFLKEMFGQRPEPWLELDATHEVPAEGVTVTSEPIPSELGIPVAEVDDRLLAVPNLAPRGSSDAIPRVAPSQLVVTARARPASLPLPAPPPSVPTAIPLPGESGPRASFAQVGSASGYTSGSHQVYPTLPMPAQAPRTQRSWPLILIVAGAAIVGSLIVWFVMRGRGGTVPELDARIVAVVESDAAEPAIAPDAAADVATDAAIAIAVDAPSAIAIDAEVPTITPDADIDAGIVIEDPPPVKKPREPDAKALFEKGRFDDAVKLCSRNLTDPPLCTRAACGAGNKDRAKLWFGKIGSSSAKSRVAAQCRDQGIELAPKKPPPVRPDAGVKGDPCEENPMDCQH